MVLRIFTVQVGPGQQAVLEPMEDEAAAHYRAAQGCRSNTFFMDVEKGEYGSVSVWESEEDIRRFAESGVLAPLIARVKPLLKETPAERIYQVYEPKAP
jgi:quinol monooxygenase YgiN